MTYRAARHSRRRVVRRSRRQASLPIDLRVIWCEIGLPGRVAQDPSALADLRNFYAAHRDALLARDPKPGWMPWAWWAWDPDAPEQFRDAGPQQNPEQTAWLLARERDRDRARVVGAAVRRAAALRSTGEEPAP
jgi:hypothetical protein